jgi:hypothetical protein
MKGLNDWGECSRKSLNAIVKDVLFGVVVMIHVVRNWNEWRYFEYGNEKILHNIGK